MVFQIGNGVCCLQGHSLKFLLLDKVDTEIDVVDYIITFLLSQVLPNSAFIYFSQFLRSKSLPLGLSIPVHTSLRKHPHALCHPRKGFARSLAPGSLLPSRRFPFGAWCLGPESRPPRSGSIFH